MRGLLSSLGRKILITLAVVVGFPVFLILVFILVLVLPGGVSGPWESNDCSHDERGSVMSPDGNWEARLTYFSCGSPLTGYLRDYTTVAILKPGQAPTQNTIAVEVEHAGQDWRISQSELAWQSNERLQVSLPASVQMNKLKSRIDGVNVSLQRVSDKSRH